MRLFSLILFVAIFLGLASEASAFRRNVVVVNNGFGGSRVVVNNGFGSRVVVNNGFRSNVVVNTGFGNRVIVNNGFGFGHTAVVSPFFFTPTFFAPAPVIIGQPSFFFAPTPAVIFP